LNLAAGCAKVFRMTTSELELKTKRFTARMSDKQLAKLHEIIEDIFDTRAVKDFRERRAKGKVKLTPMTEVEAELKALGRLK
jgi:hypothetical protein